MPSLYLTPAALGYLSQLILALLITGYFVARLLMRRADRPTHRVLLTGFFVCIALLTLLLALEAATSPSERLYFSCFCASRCARRPKQTLRVSETRRVSRA